jgi:hypothetical protein
MEKSIMKQTRTSKNIYSPLLQEDTTFCEFPECGDIATWRCYPPDSLLRSVALCDRCKQEAQRGNTVHHQAWEKDLKDNILLFALSLFFIERVTDPVFKGILIFLFLFLLTLHFLLFVLEW